MSNFQKVIDFNKSFGITVHDTPQKNIFDVDPKLVQYRLSLVLEEVKELQEGIEKKDLTEVTDALADILYVVYGFGCSVGVDLDKAYDIVHQSNMSKLCVSEEEAIATVEWYKKNELRYDSPNYRKSTDGKYWVVFNESTKKILKSINYVPADFTKIL